MVRAVVESGRDDIAHYTGNDDNNIVDLLAQWRFQAKGRVVARQIVGGLLGHWAIWTKRAAELLAEIKEAKEKWLLENSWLSRAVAVTDSNAVLFDPANQFHGCIPGIHEVLRRQGLMQNILCIKPHETLSQGQSEELDRIYRAYPFLHDDEWVQANRDTWLR